jgi:5-methylcytosine-specific restriction endonuclease McrA
MSKTCGDCQVLKPKDEFYNVASSIDGKHRYCKACCKTRRLADAVAKRDKRTGVSNRQRYRAEVEHKIAFDTSITLAKLYRRDKGICALCHTPVLPRVASIDHKIAIKNGGIHTWDNVQLTHQNCNSRKGARPESKLKPHTRTSHKPRTSSRSRK